MENDYLDYLVIELEETIGTSPHSREAIKDILQKAADFGKNKEESVNEELEEAAEKWSNNEEDTSGCDYTIVVVAKRAFKAGADWQRQNMVEALRTEYEKGRYDMREEMMKNSTDGYIRRNRYTKTNVLHLDVTCDAVQGFKNDDKLKVVFIKKE